VIGGSSGVITISVTGSTISDITSAPVALTPSFNPVDTNYVWCCAQGTNGLVLKVSSAGIVPANGLSRSQLTIPVNVINEPAVTQVAPDGTDYWIQCLPATSPIVSSEGPEPRVRGTT
jgi:hypothetical protein